MIVCLLVKTLEDTQTGSSSTLSVEQNPELSGYRSNKCTAFELASNCLPILGVFLATGVSHKPSPDTPDGI